MASASGPPQAQTAPLLLALETLYSNSTRAEKERANAYLETFQKSPEAWPIVLNFLQSESTVGTDVKIFAAQTLRSKIKYDFHQLPADTVANLRNELLGLLVVYSSGPRVIMIQICTSLAALALQLTSWNAVIQDVVKACGTTGKSLEALLQFLAVLPEEAYDGRRIILSDAELSDRIAQLLSSNANHVLDLLMTYAQSPSFKNDPTPLFFTCLTSWLTEFEIAKLTSTPLVQLAFNSLFSEDLFDSVVDFIVAMFKETREVYETGDSIKVLYDELLAVSPKLGSLGTDPDVFRGIVRMYAEAGESWVVLIAQNPQRYQFLVQCIAHCTDYEEDLEITKITFNFWYELTQLITVDNYKHAKVHFQPIYAGLVDTMIKHLHYPEGNDRTDIFKGDRVAEDKFRDFRHDMGDVLKDCCRVVGGTQCLNKAYVAVHRQLEKQSRHENVRWQDIEAPLFSMRMMAREVDTAEESVVPEVMKLLVSLPEHDKIRYAATLVLGRYTEWTAKHPEYLEFQLNYISSGFENQSKDVISAAAQALKHFCEDCKRHLVNHVSQLLPFYQNVSPALDIDSLFEVTEGVAHVVAAQPLERIYQVMGSFCQPIANELVALQHKRSAADEKDLRRVADLVELLTIFVQTVSPYVEPTHDHPAIHLLSDLWPALCDTLSIFGSTQFISESVAKNFKYIIYSYRIHSLPLLGPMAEKLVWAFEHYEYGCFLWVSGAIVRQFGHEEVDNDVRFAIWQFVERQCLNTFRLLEKHKPNDIPDLIEDFFRLLMDALYCHPFSFTKSSLLPSIVQAALASLAVELENPLTAVLHFLRDFLGYAVGHVPSAMPTEVPLDMQTAIRAQISAIGSTLCGLIVSGMIFTFPRDCVVDGAGALMTLIEMDPATSVQWIADSLGLLPPENLSPEERSKFIGQIADAATGGDYRRVQRQIQDFVAIYRRRVISPRSKAEGKGFVEAIYAVINILWNVLVGWDTKWHNRLHGIERQRDYLWFELGLVALREWIKG